MKVQSFSRRQFICSALAVYNTANFNQTLHADVHGTRYEQILLSKSPGAYGQNMGENSVSRRPKHLHANTVNGTISTALVCKRRTFLFIAGIRL